MSLDDAVDAAAADLFGLGFMPEKLELSPHDWREVVVPAPGSAPGMVGFYSTLYGLLKVERAAESAVCARPRRKIGRFEVVPFTRQPLQHGK